MTTESKAISRFETNHGEVAMTPDVVRKLFNAPTATNFEVFHFLKMCAAQRLNPFLGEAYLVKYGESPASMVVGKSTFTQRAEAHPAYDGMESGVIVMHDDGIERMPGTFIMPADKLIGGWARVHRKDQKFPTERTVSMAEYDTKRALWKTKPATMIAKVAMVQALRDAFPQTFSGLYDDSEMGGDNFAEDAIEVTATVIQDEPEPDGDPIFPPEQAVMNGDIPEFENLGAFFQWANDEHGLLPTEIGERFKATVDGTLDGLHGLGEYLNDPLLNNVVRGLAAK